MNESTSPLPWQRALWRDVVAQIAQGRLAHALLLGGPRGVGKQRFAVALTAYLLCESRADTACGKCRSCAQLAVGAHPNAYLLCRDGLLGLAASPDGRADNALVHWEPKKESKRQDVPIDAARTMIERLTLKSHYGQAKVAVVDPADGLNMNSVNALLKTIEEPTPGTHLLLVTERPQGLPATLRSRCQKLRMASPPREQALQWLAGVHGAADALAEAGGAPLLARQWAGDGALDQRREWADLWRSVAQRKRDPVAAASTVPKEDVDPLLDWLLRWLGTELRAAVSGHKAAAPAPVLSEMIGHGLDARAALDGNAAPQMLLESLLVQWARRTRPAAA